MKLDALMRRVLAELELLANASAGQVGVVSGGEPDHAGPPFVEDRVGYWRWRWNVAETDGERRKCIRDATGEIRDVRLGVHPLDERIREARLRIGEDERAVPDVMRFYRVSQATVYRCRAEAAKTNRRAA